MASGHPEWLDGMDLSWADAVAVHPYAKDSENPNDIEDQPDMQPLIREYKRFGLPVLVTEWGWPSDDEPRASAEVRDAIRWAAQTDEIEVFMFFCVSDGPP
jgi:exo-beta-1,3-glucanase (GH17 family)